MIGTYAAAVQRILIGRLLATLGATVAAVGTFVPWLLSGTRQRNSYEIFSLVDRLGFSQSSVAGLGLRLWPALPFLLVLAVALQWFHRRWITGLVATVVVVYAGIVSLAVRSARSTSLITIESGSLVTLIGTVVLAVGALVSTLLNEPSRIVSDETRETNTSGETNPRV
ncbi:MAG: hypothetical protein ABI894_05695 [Ilumatobacteraceae bacterium]